MARFFPFPFPSLLFLFFFFSFSPYYYYDVLAGPIIAEILQPNFSASYLDFVDNSGVFISSGGAAPSFSAAFYSPAGRSSSYYVAILHSPSAAVVWIANSDFPVSSTAQFSLSPAGLSLVRPDGSLAWSTPSVPRPAAALRLFDSGELRLLDAANGSLWSSFDHPTDTLLPGQLLPVGGGAAELTSATSDSDPTPGQYRLVVTSGDSVLEWVESSQFYWTISTDVRAAKDSNLQVAYMAVNNTGLYLLASDGRTAIYAAVLQPSSSRDDLRFARLDSSGRLRILRYSPNNSWPSTLATDFVAPARDCDLPMQCGSLGLCSVGANGSICGCPSMLSQSSQGVYCSPQDGYLLPNSSCSISDVGAEPPPTSYVNLDSRIGYFGNKFANPATSGTDMLACQSLCSGNCSCLGFFFRNSSKSCYLLEHQIGSFFWTDSAGSLAGYIKVLIAPTQENQASPTSSSANVIVIVVPTVASVLLVLSLGVIGFRVWRRRRSQDGNLKANKIGSNHTQGKYKSWPRSSWELSDEEDKIDDDNIWIPGLPTRFTYVELETATDSFQTKIGSGGFGTVYKGYLLDGTIVAVKKINSSVGIHAGKKEFCTEIAVIGKIHHVNLVKLRGFCAQGSKRLLVYEFMDRGSLDRSLFGPGGVPVLEWAERVAIALGAASGLAYLHSGCEHKIIHCDVKPENILLHGHGQAKIGDFGLAKLVGPDQSGLFTTMRGTRGYLAPEWLTNSSISDRTDVYSFGMVLLELVRGRRNRSEDSEPGWTGSTASSGSTGSSSYFPLVALEMHEQGRYEELGDPRLEGRVTGPEIGKMVRVALSCLHEEPALRPSMAAVAGMLEGSVPVREPRVESLGFLKIYGRSGFSYSKTSKVLSSGFMDSVLTSNRSYSDDAGTSSLSLSSPPPDQLRSYMSSQQVSGPR